VIKTIEDAAVLRVLYPTPKERVLRKVILRLDAHCTDFIRLSPFCVLSSVSRQGTPDLSPRGGPPGFVAVRDAQTLLLRDQGGNNRLDNLSNIAATSAVALLFFVPGVDETLRVYGAATILPANAFADEDGAAGSATSALQITGMKRGYAAGTLGVMDTSKPRACNCWTR